MNTIMESIVAILNSASLAVIAYLPKLIAGLLIVIIGLIAGSLLKDIIRGTFRYFRLEKWLEAAGIVKEKEVRIWPTLIAELARWLTIFIFLMSAFEVWGIPKLADVSNQLLLFFPNVIVAVVIGWIGLVAGRFAFDIVRHGVRGLSKQETLLLGNIAKYTILFFTALVILTHLGVAAELVKILFSGIVAMISLAFGLAFGLGGKEEAEKILKKLRKKIEK